jgi:hypothetical protein
MIGVWAMALRTGRIFLILVVLLAISLSARAQSTYIGPADGVWNYDPYWSPTGVPGDNSTVTISSSGTSGHNVTYDYSTPAVSLNSLTIDQTGTGLNTLSMAGFSLSAKMETIGSGGHGAFIQTGGMHTVSNLSLGSASGKSNGTYTLSDQAVLNAGSILLGNNFGTGVFTQNGGTANLGGLSLGGGGGGLSGDGNGTYNLNAGTLNIAGTEQIDTVGGTFTQTAGDHTTKLLIIGVYDNTTYTLAGGRLTVLGTDEPSLSGEFMGYFGSGPDIFNQTGGVHVVVANVLLLAYGTATHATYNLSGGSLTTPMTEVGQSGTALFNQSGGSHTTDSLILGADHNAHATYLLSNGTLAAKATTNNGTITQTGGTASLGPVDGTGSLTVSAGNLSATHLRQASLTLGGSGQIAIAPGGGSAGASRLGSLTIDLSAASTARLDLADNSLEVDFSGAAPLANIRAALLSGYAGGTWGGPGLTSSSAAADSRHGLGYAVNPTSIVVSYAPAGDGDLNGTVDFQDLTRLAQNYGKEDGTATWLQGDFNYDGNVDFADLVKIAQNYGAGISLPIAGASAEFSRDFAAAIAGVPEPSLFGTVLFAIGGCAIRFRRSRAGSAKI